jgi:hypothetical protein
MSWLLVEKKNRLFSFEKNGISQKTVVNIFDTKLAKMCFSKLKTLLVYADK